MNSSIPWGKYLLFVVAAILLASAALIFWLRFEFARVQSTPFDTETTSAAVERLQDNLAGQKDCAENHRNNKAYFGALHVHTAASYDATAFGVTTTVDQAYRFGKGTPTPLSLQGDTEDFEAPIMKISSPLDFMAVTDHASGLGENRLCYTPGSEAYGTLVCRLYRGDVRLPVNDNMQSLIRLATQAVFGQDRSTRVCGEDGSRCRTSAIEVWKENQRATEAHLDRSASCSFTTFHAYEYTLAEEASNLHRNVIFATDVIPQAQLSAKEAPHPEQLWQWLDRLCIAGSPNCDALAIPHNSNWSSGRMWYPISLSDRPLEEQQQLAQLRQRVEPLAEMMQVKGDSECRNGIASVIGAADEFCDFEKLRPAQEVIEDCGETIGSKGMMLQGCVSRYSYVRYALTAGLAEAAKLGSNPFELGIVAASDTHIGMPMAGREADHPGSHGNDRDIQHRLLGKIEVPGGIATGSPVRYNPGGIAGIYAPENSRSALFSAMQRKETFGTSGPRIQPRFFAGSDLASSICESAEFLDEAYAGGVPMGGRLHGDTTTGSPTFVASAWADPRDGGQLLERIQIIKGWVDDQGQTHQAVYDIAGNPLGEASVDPETCATSGPGYRQLCATWRDPDFDATRSAVYYSRVLENPSCRWSQFNCLSLAPEDRPDSCSDPELPKTIQERAWTSPIWYYPQSSSAFNSP